MKKNWQYFIHSTAFDFLEVLHSGYLLPKTNYEEYVNHPIIPASYVYTHLIFNGLPQNNKINWSYFKHNNTPFIFVIDPNLTKEYEMYICRGLYYGYCVKNSDSLLIHTNGTKKVLLTKIKNYIYHTTLDSLDKYKKNSFIYTHEALFPKIPIQYVKAILINKNMVKQYIKQIDQAIEEYPNIKFIIFDHREPNFDIYFENI